MPRTRFADFMDANEQITVLALADRTAMVPAYISGLLTDTTDPTRPEMIAIAGACEEILGRKVRVTELFDLGDGER